MRLKLLKFGSRILTFFLTSSIILTLCTVFLWIKNHTLIETSTDYIFFGIFVVLSICLELLLFWTGIIMVYITSVQLGIKTRIIGIICGWIPFVNIYMLTKIIRICKEEYRFETEKIVINERRKHEKICETKYPILLVHGVFFRDFKHLNYWGRIPDELKKNGAIIYYGNHNSAASVADSAKELEKTVEKILKETGAEKINIIAHSKGGLDSRVLAIIMPDKIASITTINTPHKGCEFADYLLSKIPEKQQEIIARKYNLAASKLGDVNPDFLAAVRDLTFEKCEKRNKIIKDVPGIYYQSLGSKLNKATSGKFPLNFTYHLVKYFDGENDGLVGEKSFEWGNNYKYLTIDGKRGISHADMIDLNRENIKDFDIREFYVNLVSELKKKGY